MVKEEFDFKAFVISAKENENVKKVFWTVFAFLIIGVILNNVPIIGRLISLVIGVYVGWKYIVNVGYLSALKNLKYSVSEIELIDLIVFWIYALIAIVLPWWTGHYLWILVGLYVLALFGLVVFPFISIFFLVLVVIFLFYNGVRLSLSFVAYMRRGKKDKVEALKESWALTEGKVIRTIIYNLKVLWYTITKEWIAVVLAIILLLGYIIFVVIAAMTIPQELLEEVTTSMALGEFVLVSIIVGLLLSIVWNYLSTCYYFYSAFGVPAIYYTYETEKAKGKK